MALPTPRKTTNRKLYRNGYQAFTVPPNQQSKNNKCLYRVESNDLYFPREVVDENEVNERVDEIVKIQKDLESNDRKLGNGEVEKIEDDVVEGSEADLNPVDKSSLSELLEEGEDSKEEEKKHRYVIIGFDTEYVSTKLRKVVLRTYKKQYAKKKKVKDETTGNLVRKEIKPLIQDKFQGWLRVSDEGDDDNYAITDYVIDTKVNGWEEELQKVNKNLINIPKRTDKRAKNLFAIQNDLLSYQFYCATDLGEEWSGVIIPSEGDVEANKDESTIVEKDLGVVETTNEEGKKIKIPIKVNGRTSISEFIMFALGKGLAEIPSLKENKIPTTVYLVGHFTRTDIVMFRDFENIAKYLTSIRKTFTTEAGGCMKLNFKEWYTSSGKPNIKKTFEIQVHIRDTMLLTPTSEKSLKSVGKMIARGDNVYKPDPSIEKKDLRYFKKLLGVDNVYANMRKVRDEYFEDFKEYGIQDCKVCVRYLQRLLTRYQSLTDNSTKLPVTLTQVGVDMLLKEWSEKYAVVVENEDGTTETKPNKEVKYKLLGKEKIVEKVYYTSGKAANIPKEPYVPSLFFAEAFLTECYHGGRNEQFWFGPGSFADWYDWDLSSCYPIAMATVPQVDWENIKYTTNLDDFLDPTTLGYAWVEFDFTKDNEGNDRTNPYEVRFPCLPIRSDSAVIFPLKGKSYTSTPEICVARKLGCKITIKHGLIIPKIKGEDSYVFRDYVKLCVSERNKAKVTSGKKSLDDLLWKELCNATYGKVCQGLGEKRVFDLREKKTVTLGPSKITNPAFAAYITSFARATLSEIINSIPRERVVFSCTTDGFMTNASRVEVESIQNGMMCSLFRKSSSAVQPDGEGKVLEVKHRIARPLGWRTRGQATMQIGSILKDVEVEEENRKMKKVMSKITGEVARTINLDESLFLAKASIRLNKERQWMEREEGDGTLIVNNEIIKLFLNRSPNTRLPFLGKSSIKDILAGADFIQMETSKILSMEFDWKRIPYGVDEMTIWDPQFMSEVTPQLKGSTYWNFNKHIYFSTRPLMSYDEYQDVRHCWEFYTAKEKKCIKTCEDLAIFGEYVNSSVSLQKSGADSYLKEYMPDVMRMLQYLTYAIRQSCAGLTYLPPNGCVTAVEWERSVNKVLSKFTYNDNDDGIFYTPKINAEYIYQAITYEDWLTIQRKNKATYRRFVQYQPHHIPKTKRVVEMLTALKNDIPQMKNLDIDDMVSKETCKIFDLEEIRRDKKDTKSKCDHINNFVKYDTSLADDLMTEDEYDEDEAKDKVKVNTSRLKANALKEVVKEMVLRMKPSREYRLAELGDYCESEEEYQQVKNEWIERWKQEDIERFNKTQKKDVKDLLDDIPFDNFTLSNEVREMELSRVEVKNKIQQNTSTTL